MDNAQGLRFRATIERLSPAMISQLIDLAEGGLFYPDIWQRHAFEELDLIVPLRDRIHAGCYTDALTPFGEAFVAWMREPREVPQQLELFE